MATAPAFDLASEELERWTFFNRLESRGTLRLAVREAGLDPHSVTASQMAGVVENFLPRELRSRGVERGEAICSPIRRVLVRSPAG